MKKPTILLTALFILIGNAFSFASEDYSFSIGFLSWYNRFNPISRVRGMDVPQSTFALMTGPTIKAQYKDVFLDVTYLLSNCDYNLISPNTLVNVHRADANSSATRKDIDIIIGYMLTPKWSVNIGFEGIYVDDNVSLTSPRAVTNGRRFENYNIGLVGVGAYIPLSGRFVWISNGDILLGAFHNDVAYPPAYNALNESPYNTAAWGGNIDTRIVCNLLKHLSADVGVKIQYIKAGSDNSSFFGPAIRLDYKF